MRMAVCFAAVLLGALATGWSQSSISGGETPVQIVGSKIDELQALIDKNGDEYRRDPAQFYGVVDRLVVPAFDLDYISQVVVGRAWRAATSDQQQRFKAAFKHRLIVFYGDALLERARRGQSGWKLSEIDAVDRTARVRAQLPQKSGPPVSLGFDMRLDDENRWLVSDMTVEGLSLVQNFRSQFAPVLKRSGLDVLTTQMESGAIATGTWQPPGSR